MPNTRTLQRSFSGGELAPSMWGKVGDPKHSAGAARLLNMVCTPTGEAVRCPGRKFVRAAKASGTRCVLRPFTFGLDDTMVIEIGVGYFRFHTDGGTVTHPVASAWSGATPYVAGDFVSRLGVTYQCILAHTNQQPPNATYWYAQPSTGEYQVGNTYIESNLRNIDWEQKGDVLTLTHPDHDRGALTRVTATHWTFVQSASYGPVLTAPTISSITRTFGAYTEFSSDGASPTLFTTVGSLGHGLGVGDMVYVESVAGGIGGSGAPLGGGSPVPANFYEVTHIGAPGAGQSPIDLRLKFVPSITGASAVNSVVLNVYMRYAALGSVDDNEYVVTALTADGDESMPSASSTATGNNLTVDGSYNTIAWSAITGAARYRVYKKKPGLGIFGAIGETEELSFKDEDNLGVDAGVTPPRQDTTLGTAQPGLVARFETRHVFSGEEGQSQTLWFTATGTEISLIYHLPLIDTDRIKITLQSFQSCPIRHLVPLDNLVVLTSTAEFVVTPVNQDAITPLSYRARSATYIGANNVKPLVVNNTILFPAARGGHVFQFARSSEQGYESKDVCWRSAHLFDDYEIVDAASMKAPYPIEWFVSSSGSLLGFTYVPNEDVGGWHEHTVDGVIESCCVVAEGTEDALYLAVARTIGGSTVRYIERMNAFAFDELEDAYHVDCGLTYSGSAATTLSGLSHLNGETVQVLGDGVDLGDFVVASGAISLPTAVTKAQVGLEMDSQLRTLPVGLQIDQGLGQGRTKNINRLWLRAVNSARFSVGTEVDHLVPTNDIDDGEMVTAEVDVTVPGDWTDGGQVYVAQSRPLPLSIATLCAEVSIGS